MEIVQLYQVRKMWEDLQRQIRSLHVTVRIQRQNCDQTEGRDTDDANSNPGPSTSTANPATESARNFKKTLLENYQRENETDGNARMYDQSQPSTSRGITGRERNLRSKPASSSNIEESTTNMSLSNLLPSDAELRRMQWLKPGSYTRSTSRCQNCDFRVNDDHTYSIVTTGDNTQLPSMFNVVSNIANSNLPAVTAITTTEPAESSQPLPGMSSFANDADRDIGSGRSSQVLNANLDSSNNNESNDEDNANLDFLTQRATSEENSASASLSDSSPNSRLHNRKNIFR